MGATRCATFHYFDKCRGCECLEGHTCKHPNAKEGNDIPVYYRKGKTFKCPKQEEKLYLYIYCLTKGTLTRWSQDVKEVAPKTGRVSYYTDKAHQHWNWVEADSLNRIERCRCANNITIHGLEAEDYSKLVYTWSCDDPETVMKAIMKWMANGIAEVRDILERMTGFAETAQQKLCDIHERSNSNE